MDADTPIKERGKIIGEVVNEFLRRYSVSPTNIFVGIPRDRVILKNIILPLAVKENLRGALGYEMEKYTPFVVDDVFFDFQWLGEDNVQNTLEILLAVAKKEDLISYLGLKELIGRGISGIEISSAAIVNSLSHICSCPADNAYTIVYLAEKYFEVAIMSDGRLGYARRYACAEDHELLFQRISQGVEQVQKSSRLKKESVGLLLCGPAASEKTAHALREDGYSTQEVNGASINLPSQELMPALGLALRGLNSLPNQMNLLPPEMQKRPSRSGYYLMVILLMMAVFCGFGWWGSRIQQQRLLIENLDRQVAHLRSEVAASEEIRKQCEEVRGKLDALISVTSREKPVLEVLKELTNRVPQSAWLNGLSLSKGKVVITGYAERASVLIPVLEASPLFQNVVFLSTITKTREGRERFRIGFKVG